MAEISQQKIFDVIGSLYENAHMTSNESWAGVYRQMADLISSGPGGLTIFDTRNIEFQTSIGTIDPGLVAEYFDKYQHIDPFRDVVAGMKAGDTFGRRDHLSDEDFRNSDIYTSFFARAGMFHIQYYVFTIRSGIHGGITFSRGEGERDFDGDELEAMAFILPHLERAFQLYIRLHETRRENKIMAEAFNRIPQSVLIVDGDHKLVFANTSARDILDHKDGLDIDRRGRLHAASAADARGLRAMLARVFDNQSIDGPDHHGGLLQIRRPSGLRPFEVLVAPFTEDHRAVLDHQPMAMLFISNQEQKLQNIDAMLRRMYSLTTAEARIASLLTDGQTLNDVCEKLNIKQNTARTHLKHIFSKTGTNRQSELVTLILNGPGRLREFRAGAVSDKPT